MIEYGSEGSLRLATFAWRRLQDLRDRLIYCGCPAPLDVMTDVVEADLEPAERDDFTDLHTLVLHELRVLRVTADLFSAAAVQAALREGLAMMRVEAGLDA